MKKIIDLFRKKADYGNPAGTPEERVRSFLSHWHAQWRTATKKMGSKVDFDVWGELVGEVDKQHFVKGWSSGTSNSFGSVADFDQDLETITECDISGNSTHVYAEKRDPSHGLSRYHVYELHCSEKGNWLIVEITTLFDPPKSPVVEAARLAEIQAMSAPDAPLVVGQANLHLNENTLFQGDRRVALPNQGEGQATVQSVGKLRLNSGLIGIMDFGYDMDSLVPLHRKVEPGEYVVETVSIHDRVAGIRIRFDEQENPVKWYAANTPQGNGVYGVDAGNLAVFEVASLSGLSHIQKEKLFGRWARSGEPQLFSMTAENDCFITPSGYGDGAYPAFWGVNEKEKVVSLYVDFMVLVREGEDGNYVSV